VLLLPRGLGKQGQWQRKPKKDITNACQHPAWPSAGSWESHSPRFHPDRAHGAVEGADGSFLTGEASLCFDFHMIKGSVLITTEVLQARRVKSPHPEMLLCYTKSNGFVCTICPWAFLKQ